MAREWIINDYLGYKGLILQDCNKQKAGPGEIRLRIEAFAINWGDLGLMKNQYSFSFNNFPARIGIEAAKYLGFHVIHLTNPKTIEVDIKKYLN